MTDKLMFRINELAEATGLTRTRIYELMRSGELDYVQVGRHRMVTRRAADEFIARLEAGAVASEVAS